METTLRMFYARALFALCFFFFVFFVAFAGVAFAQDAAPAVPVPQTDPIDLIFSSASAAIVSLFGAVMLVITRYAPQWVVALIEHLTTSEAVKWEALLDSAMDRAEAYARSKFDLVKDRAGYLNAMVMFMHTFNPEIVRWADKNNNGVIDLIESRLPAGPTPPKPGAAAAADVMPLRSRRRVSEVN